MFSFYILFGETSMLDASFMTEKRDIHTMFLVHCGCSYPMTVVLCRNSSLILVRHCFFSSFRMLRYTGIHWDTLIPPLIVHSICVTPIPATQLPGRVVVIG
jgi:hypothetical protein